MSPAGRPSRSDVVVSGHWQFLTLDLAPDTGFGRHRHDEHQLAVVERGVVGLETPDEVWAVPRGVGVWLPAGAEHRVIGIADASVTFAYVTTSGWSPPPAGAVTLEPLLRDAVAVLSTRGARRGDRRRRLEAVLLDELDDIRPVRLLLALPVDPSARLVAAAIIGDPSDRRTIDAFGREVGSSGRTLQRRFAEETGLGFREWRGRARLQRAMVELEADRTVTETAFVCGFSSVSAFVNAFRTAIGTTPAQWTGRAREGVSVGAVPSSSRRIGGQPA
jgi:AraC-like DNA-binding protein